MFYKSNDRGSGNSGSNKKSNGKPNSFERRNTRPGGNKPNSGRSDSGRGRGPVKKFNPSMFIKKVEEQVVAPVYVPKNTFNDFLLEQQVKENIATKGYLLPTPVQDQAIPLILEGKDILATANTGTGKTAAFLLPLVSNVIAKKTERVLIITPTRELAAQIQVELDSFKIKTGQTSVLCIGGLNMGFQIQHLKKNPTFVIGTPGRLRDLEENGHLSFGRYNAIVLDEVDTMLDMGFINDIKYIVGKLPKKRHSLFFSATLPKDTKEIMDRFLTNPVAVNVKTRQSAENVNQDILKVDQAGKVEALHNLLIKPEFKRVIIFSRTKRATDKLAKALRERGFEVASIHGDKTQAQRQKALLVFKDGRVKILLATDVVARGIDIDDVTHVINYDLPQTYEDYIHRIGRTGRANKIGQAITFIE
ncbi:MAG: DEAD/DEAH box helicase [Candidatus Dependentiae bacterium]|nr:DEAD/DEAH box helicase [Candidatus Dependentiae bacterium]